MRKFLFILFLLLFVTNSFGTDTTKTPAVNGYIKDLSGVKTAYDSAAWGACGEYPYDAFPAEYQSAAGYDTGSAIPDDATIDDAVLNYVYSATQSAFKTVSNWKTNINVGTFLETTIDAGDWGEGTNTVTVDWDAAANACGADACCPSNNPCTCDIDLGAGANALINKTGQTDVILIDNSAMVSGNKWDANNDWEGKVVTTLTVSYTEAVGRRIMHITKTFKPIQITIRSK